MGLYGLKNNCCGLQACGRASEGSKRETGFYELDVQVKGVPSLEDSLVRKPKGIERV